MTMTKLREYAKAIAALLGAVATFLVSVNAPPQWSVWLGSIVAVLTGIATLGVPNKINLPAPADAAITAIQQTVQNVTDAASELDRVKEAATGIIGSVPVVGPLAQQIINSVIGVR